MAQRKSGFKRVASELYQTPAWVLDALAEHIEFDGTLIWEPACGEGQLVRAMHAHGATLVATDLHDYGKYPMLQMDFLDPAASIYRNFHGIVTNPPYGPNGRTAEKFIEAGLARLPPGGFMALLLGADFDSGGSRARLFRECPDFAGRVVLNRRIVWFEPEPREDGKAPSGPSANHTWFIWHRPHIWTGAAPFTLYAPGEKE